MPRSSCFLSVFFLSLQNMSRRGAEETGLRAHAGEKDKDRSVFSKQSSRQRCRSRMF